MPVPFVEQAGLARSIWTISVAAFAAGEFRQALHLRRGASRSNLRAELLFRALFFGGVLLLPIGRALVPGATIGGGAWLFTLGTVVGWLGLALRWWAFISLGRFFTTVVRTTADQPVVTRGPYRVLRHPSYTGLLIAFTGAGLMFGNWVGTAGAVAVLLVALIYRLRIEERALTAATGDRYSEFAASRARLIPFVW